MSSLNLSWIYPDEPDAQEDVKIPPFFEDFEPPSTEPNQAQEASLTSKGDYEAHAPLTLSETKRAILDEIKSRGTTLRLVRLCLQAVALATNDMTFLNLARSSLSPLADEAVIRAKRLQN